MTAVLKAEVQKAYEEAKADGMASLLSASNIKVYRTISSSPHLLFQHL